MCGVTSQLPVNITAADNISAHMANMTRLLTGSYPSVVNSTTNVDSTDDQDDDQGL